MKIQVGDKYRDGWGATYKVMRQDTKGWVVTHKNCEILMGKESIERMEKVREQKETNGEEGPQNTCRYVRPKVVQKTRKVRGGRAAQYRLWPA